MLRDLFVKTTSKRREPTVTVLSESSMSRLGTKKELKTTQTPNCAIPDSVLAILQSCLIEAIPGCTFGEQKNRGGGECGIIFNGHYAVPPPE